MRVDHRRRQVAVPQQLLNRPDVVPGLQQMGRKRMPQGMGGDALGDLRLTSGRLDGTLNDRFVEMVPALLVRLRVPVPPGCWKNPLPPTPGWRYGTFPSAHRAPQRTRRQFSGRPSVGVSSNPDDSSRAA